MCIALHASLVTVHVAAAVLWSKHWEHSVVLDVGDTANAWQTGSTVLLSVSSVIYLTILVYHTQRIALRRTWSIQQPLTALHDRWQAWLGPFAALTSLANQRTVSSSAGFTVATVASYLLCVLVLHNSTPALLNLPTFNETTTTVVNTRRQWGPVSFRERVPFPFLSSFNLYPSMPTAGRAGAVMLDTVVPSADAPLAGVASVYATQFCSSCRTMVPETERPFVERSSTSWNGTFGSEPYFVAPQNAPVVRIPRLTMVDPSVNYGPPVPESKSILVMANINLTSGSSETVNNIHLPSAPHASIAFSRLSHLVFLNCSLQWTHHRAYVTLTNDLINVDEEVLDITNVDYSSICKHCAGRWGSEWSLLLSWATDAPHASSRDNHRAGILPTGNLTIPEEWLMNELGLSTAWTGNPGAEQNLIPPLSVNDVENALAKMTAAMYWSAEHVTHYESVASGYDNGTATARVVRLRRRLNITTVPLFAGLAASFIMSVLAILLTRAIPRPHRVHASPSTIGLLQWSHALGALDAPANAKQNDLRRTGMETEWDGLGGLTEPARLRPSTRLDEGDKSTLCESEV